MEAKYVRVLLLTLLAPVAWGSTYFVTRNYLPHDLPLWGSVLRALPAGLILLTYTRTLPSGIWWRKSLLISFLTISGFFTLIYISGSRLPSSIAAMLMSLSPIVTMAGAYLILKEKPTSFRIIGSVMGVTGVFLLLNAANYSLDFWGLIASLLAMLLATLGFLLTKKWNPPVPVTTFTAWQLTLGGLSLLPLALIFEGIPTELSPQNGLAFAYISLIATALAYICWFTGLKHLPAGTVGILGLANPLTGAVLGLSLAGEVFTPLQWLAAAIMVCGIVLGALPHPARTKPKHQTLSSPPANTPPR